MMMSEDVEKGEDPAKNKNVNKGMINVTNVKNPK